MLGYGVIRPAREGHKIGPLFAEGPQEADLIFRALASTVKGEALVIDPPDPNTEAIDLVERHDLSPVFETARMYRGAAPDLPLDRIFGITTFRARLGATSRRPFSGFPPSAHSPVAWRAEAA